MALDQAIDILNVLVPIAKAVPILGAPVEGSLEALSRILEFAQARYLHGNLVGVAHLAYNSGGQVYQEENGGACRPSRSLAEDCIRRAEGGRAQSGSL
jgi:hypothetical protein